MKSGPPHCQQLCMPEHNQGENFGCSYTHACKSESQQCHFSPPKPVWQSPVMSWAMALRSPFTIMERGRAPISQKGPQLTAKIGPCAPMLLVRWGRVIIAFLYLVIIAFLYYCEEFDINLSKWDNHWMINNSWLLSRFSLEDQIGELYAWRRRAATRELNLYDC